MSESRKAFEMVHSAHDLRWNDITGYSSRETRIAYAGWLTCWNRRDAEIAELQAENVRILERADALEGKRALAESRVFDLSNQLREAHQDRDQLKSCERSMREALEHALLVFRSMADRGRYPLEVLPLDEHGDPNKHYLGKQGLQFITDALAHGQPAPLAGDPQSNATHYECPTCGNAVPHGASCHHNL